MKKNSHTAALYCRLSKDDRTDVESNSISNQKAILSRYAEEHGFTRVRVYADDGYTGLNFDRPAFRQMLADAENGDIDTIIVKDMSRFGRTYLEVGILTEIKFPQMGIHFIAVNDNVDSENDSGNDLVPIRNIMNEWYSRDISIKVRSSMKTRAQKGEHLTGKIPYGYQRDPADRKHWIIDPVKAEIVRDIFRMYIEGGSSNSISKELTTRGIPTPQQAETGWHPNVILRILDQYQYCGHTVSGIRVKKTYRSRHVIRQPEEKWIITRNTQEAIIDEVIWQKVHNMRQEGPHRQRKYPSQLDGLLFCSDCGAAMGYSHDKRSPGSSTFHCKKAEHRVREYSHTVSQTNMERIISAYTGKVIYIVFEKEDWIFEKALKQYMLHQHARVEQLAAEQKTAVLRKQEIENILTHLQNDLDRKILTEQRVSLLQAQYATELQKLDEQQNLHDVYNAVKDEDANMLRHKIMCACDRLKTMTADTASALLERVDVGQRRMSTDGCIQQEIHIVFRFYTDLTNLITGDYTEWEK